MSDVEPALRRCREQDVDDAEVAFRYMSRSRTVTAKGRVTHVTENKGELGPSHTAITLRHQGDDDRVYRIWLTDEPLVAVAEGLDDPTMLGPVDRLLVDTLA